MRSTTSRVLMNTLFSLLIWLGTIAATSGDAFADGKPEWTRQSGTSAEDAAVAVAVDGNGNVYSTGYTYGGLDGNSHTGAYNSDIFLVKHDRNGVKQWTRQLGTTVDERAYAIAADSAGNVYVTGYTDGVLGDGISASAGSSDMLLVKYDTAGTKLWTRQLGSAGSDSGRGVALDAAGYVYAAGVTTGGLDGNSNSGSADLFLVKYSSSGVKQWTKQMGTAGDDIATAVTVDASGNIYLAGYTKGWLGDGTGSNAGGNDLFAIKLNASGVKLWARQMGTAIDPVGGVSGNDEASGIAVDASGNVYVTGNTFGALDGNPWVPGAYNSDIFLVKYDKNGIKQWTRQLGTIDLDEATGVTVDTIGNVYVSGSVYGSFNGNWYEGYNDILVAQFSSLGVMLWSRQLGTPGGDRGLGVAVDKYGYVYVAGSTSGGLDGNINAGPGYSDAFVAKYDSMIEWKRQLGTNLHDYTSGVAADKLGNVYVTGYTDGGMDNNTNAGYMDMFLTSYTSAGVKQWTRQLGQAGGDYAYAVAADSQGNAYVTGYTDGALDGNVSAGGSDIFLVKYDSAGTKQWTKQLGSNGGDYPNAIAVDANDNIIITGTTTGWLGDGEGSNFGLYSSDVFVIKLSSAGEKIWARQFGSSDSDYGQGVALDKNGNIYVTGSTEGGLDNYVNTGATYSTDLFLVKFDASGNKLWLRQLGTNEYDRAYGVAVDGNGNAYLTGQTYGGLDNNANSGPAYTWDIFLVKYDTNGTKLWTRETGSTVTASSVDDYANGVAVDANGNAYITGQTLGSLDGNPNAGGGDILLFKYDSSGNKLWTRQMGTSGTDSGSAITVDGNGSVYVAGNVMGIFGGNLYSGYLDMGLVKFNTAQDIVAPVGSVSINTGATASMASTVTLNLTCTDISGCRQMQFSGNNSLWSPLEPYSAVKVWDLTSSTYGGTAGDGSKTVYARFTDYTGNVSAISSSSITLDTLKPSGTIQINTNAKNTNSMLVLLNLGASDSNGISLMQFSNDGRNWSAPEAFNSVWAWMLSSGDGLKTVSARFSDPAGNWSAPVSAEIILDTTPPSTQISPAGGDKTTGVSVSLTCNDGTGSGCAATYYTLDNTPPTILSSRYTGSISISGLTTPVTLNYFSVDNLGNAEPYKTATYSFIAGYTTLTLDTPPTLLQNGLLDVSGKLTRYPDSQTTPNNNMDLSGLPVRLTVTGPAGSPCADGCVENTTTYTALGHYKFTGLNLFSFKGTYTIKADFLGTGLHQPSHSGTQSLLVGASAGYAIIVQGKVNGDAGLESHNKTTGRIYETLKERGFVDDNIMYFNYAGTVVPGVDAVPAVGSASTPNTIQWAVETWARDRMNGSPAPLYVIFVDHGNNDTFYIDPDTIASSDLNGWLNNLETNLLPVAKREKRVIILGACYSGSFLETLKQAPIPGTNAGRIIISSAAADEQSYKGPNEPDGIRGGEFFIEEFFKQLRKGFSIKAAFVEAAALTRTFTSQGSGSANSVNAYNDTAVQHPLLEDDGQGAGSNTLLDGIGDGLEAAALHLGFGVTNAALGPADLKAVSGTHYLAYNVSSTPTALWSEAYSNSAVSSAWFEIKAPSTTLSGTAGTNQLALNLPTGLMELKLSGRWEAVPAAVPSFPTAGKYEIYYFTKSTNQEISEMKRSLVYKNKQNNQKPSTFNLVSPGAGGVEEQTRTELNFVWDATTDPDGDSLTYTLQIATDEAFTTVVYQREEIENSWFALDASAGLKDKTHYYWRVLAVDRYGEIRTSNQEWRFMTDDTNSLPAQIIGTVTDALGNPVAGAVVSAVLSGAVKAQASAGSGAYALLPSPGTYTVTASAPGYIDNQSSPFSVSSGSVYTVPKITLNPAQSILQVSVSGSGQVYQSPAGAIDCTSSDTAAAGCHTTAANGTLFSLVATAADWRSLFTAWSGVTCNGNDNTLSVCNFILNSNTIVTAAFGPNYQAKLATDVQYASLQEALDAATPGTTVQAKAYTFQEAILFNRPDDAVITVEGGCVGVGYSPSVGGRSTVSGSLRVRRGAIKIKGPLAVR